MRNFIRQQLRLVLEGSRMDAKHTSANSFGGERGFKPTTQDQYNNAVAQIEQAKKEYYPIKMGDLYEGDGLYEMKLHTNGYMTVKQSSISDKRSPGMFNDNNTKTIRYFYAMANRGISHDDIKSDDYSELEDTGKRHSPAEQAALKMKVLFKYEILEFLKMNMSGESEYTTDKAGAAQQVATKGDQYTQMRKSEKLAQNIEKEKNKPEITQSDDYEAELERENAELSRQIKLAMDKGDRKTISQLRSKAKRNQKEIKFIQRLRNLLMSDPNHATKIPQEIEAAGMSYLYKYLPWLSQFQA